MLDNAAVEKEKHMKQLKRRLECWREIVLEINSILLWDKSWHPGLILCFTTYMYIFICYLEPAFLTAVAIGLLTFALIDYLVPIAAASFISPNAWNGQKERKFDEICQNLSETILRLQKEWKYLLNARNNRSHLYYGSICACLLLLAWIGNTVDNLLLIFMAVSGILMTPGLRHKCRAENAVKFALNYMMGRKLSQ